MLSRPSVVNDIDGAQKFFTERIEWSNSWQQNSFIYGKPEDLNNVYFKIPWIWSRVYRASECESIIIIYYHILMAEHYDTVH